MESHSRPYHLSDNPLKMLQMAQTAWKQCRGPVQLLQLAEVTPAVIDLPIKAATLRTPLSRCMSKKISAPYTVVTKGGNYHYRPNMHWTWLFLCPKVGHFNQEVSGDGFAFGVSLEQPLSAVFGSFAFAPFFSFRGFSLGQIRPISEAFILISTTCLWTYLPQLWCYHCTRFLRCYNVSEYHHLQWPLRKENKLDICCRGAKKEGR